MQEKPELVARNLHGVQVLDGQFAQRVITCGRRFFEFYAVVLFLYIDMQRIFPVGTVVSTSVGIYVGTRWCFWVFRGVFTTFYEPETGGFYKKNQPIFNVLPLNMG